MPSFEGSPYNLISVDIAFKYLFNGQEDYLKIKPKGPVFDVPEVEFDPFLHIHGIPCFSSIAVDLRPARDAGFNQMS